MCPDNDGDPPGLRRNPPNDSTTHSLRQNTTQTRRGRGSNPPRQRRSAPQPTRTLFHYMQRTNHTTTHPTTGTNTIHNNPGNTNTTNTTNNPARTRRRTRPHRQQHPTDEEQKLPFGDPLTEKPSNVARIMGSTLGSQGLKPWDPTRYRVVKDFIRSNEADIYGAYEVNTNWAKVPAHERPDEIFRNDRPLRCQTSHNKHDNGTIENQKQQQGGTMLVAVDGITAKLIQKGQDHTGLGRWSWVLLQGGTGIRTRIISAYCPVRSNERRMMAVYSQQKRWFSRFKKDDTCPRKLFVRDLCQLISSCRQKNERIILLIDANDNVLSSPLSTALAELDIREAITGAHQQQRPPATYIRGSRVIDGIFISPEIQPDKAGFLPFNEIGDHRPTYIDIPWRNLLGEDQIHIERPPARRLITRDPRVMKKYIRTLERYLIENRIVERLSNLANETATQATLTPPQQLLLEEIDTEITAGMIYAERRCRKLRMGDLDFSPAMIQAWNTKILWKLILERKQQSKKRSKTKIRRLARKLGVTRPLQCTEDEARANWTEACISYKNLKPLAGVTRQEYLQERKTDPTISEEARKRAQQMLLTEQSRSASRQVQRLKGKIKGGTIVEVDVFPPANQAGPPLRITGKGPVEEAIMNMVQKRYRLTEATPLMLPGMRALLGLCGDTEASEALLQGALDPTDLTDPNTAALLRLFRRNPDNEPLPELITQKAFQKYWAKAREDTSSSASGRHFGHYKAAAKNDTLSYVHTTMCNLAYAKGQPLTRWKSGVTVMLEKEPGVIDVERLRAILLLEADFNFANKHHFGQNMVRNAHNTSTIPDEAFGGIANRNPHYLALTRKSFIDLATLLLITIAIASVDAAQCYDCIQHTAASLACQAWGVSRRIMQTILKTVQSMKIFLRTAHGDTTNHIPNSSANPFQGILQGNGAGPAIWLAVSAFIILLLHTRRHVTNLITPITRTSRRLAGLFFVDDTDLIILADPNESNQSVIQRLQHSVDSWQGGLQATGGALKRKKCTWSIKAYEHRNGQPRVTRDSNLPGSITIQEEGQPMAIKRLPPDSSVTAIGFTQSLDGSMTGEIEKMTQKADRWGHQIRHGRLDRRLAWHALRTTIWPSLKFPLSVCTLTWKKGDEIIKQLYKALLPSLGANRNFPKLWRHAPPDFMGLDLPHPFVEQTIDQYNLLLTLGESNSLPWISLRAQLEAAQLIIGSAEEYYHTDPDKWTGLLDPTTLAHQYWLTHWEYDIFAELETPLAPPPQRENDQTLMGLLETLPNLTTDTIQSFNRCRLAKQAYFLSDITSGDGKTILLEYWERHPAFHPPRTSSWTWPRTKPSNADWDTWRSCLSDLFPHRLLPATHQLGRWICSPHLPHTWFLAPNSNTLWEQRDNEWHQYQAVYSRSGTTHFAHQATHTQPPEEELLPTTTQPTGRLNRRKHTGTSTSTPPAEPPPTISDRIRLLKEYGWPLETAWFPNEGLEIAQAIIQGTAIGVSDGSYKPNQSKSLATAAWTILDLHTKASIGGVLRVSGQPRDTNAYRAELQGLHTMLLAIKIICDHHNVTQGSIVLGLDNETGVNQGKNPHLDPTTSIKHVDLIRAIRRLIAEIPIEVHLDHVKGHQDTKSTRPLNPLEELNVLADEMAKHHLDALLEAAQLGRLGSCPDHIYKEGTRIFANDIKCTDDVGPAFRHAIFAPAMRTWLDEHDRLDSIAFDLVDWQAIRLASKNTVPLFRLWGAKNACGQCGVGKWLYTWKFADSPHCPLCLAPEEDARHVVTCPSAVSREAFRKGLIAFEATLKDIKTEPNIRTCLVGGIRRRHESFINHSDGNTTIAANEQDLIGWAATMEGRISHQWRSLQNDHLMANFPQRSAEIWASQVVEAIWTLTHSVWDTRCKTVHDMARAEDLQLRQQTLDDAIRAEYSQYRDEEVSATDRYLFEQDVTYWISRPIYEKETWLQAVNWAKEKRVEEVDNEYTGMRETMANWLNNE